MTSGFEIKNQVSGNVDGNVVQTGSVGRDLYVTFTQSGESTYRKIPTRLPSDPKSFVGRGVELGKLADSVRGMTHGRLAVVSGQPGVGKTALATRFANLNSKDYPDGQLYIDLRGTFSDALTPQYILSRVIREIEGTDTDAAGSVDELSAIYRDIASRKRFLIVLDNASSEQQVRPLTPGSSQSVVVVTSRYQLNGLEFAQRVHLGILPPDDAAKMLTEHIADSRSDAEPNALYSIAELCGYLPLALRIASRIAQRAPKWSLKYISKRLADEQSKLDTLAAGDLGVRTSFQLSYDLLTREQRATFRKICVIPGPTFDDYLAKEAIGARKRIRAASAVDTLVERGLVETAQQDGRYIIHDLIKLFGEEKLKEAEGKDAVLETVRNVRQYLLNGVIDASGAVFPNPAGALDVTMREARSSAEPLVWLDQNYANIYPVLVDAVKDGFYNDALRAVIPLSSYTELRGEWLSLEELANLGQEAIRRVKRKGTFDPEGGSLLEIMLLAMQANSANGLRDFDRALEHCGKAWTIANTRIPPSVAPLAQAMVCNVRGNTFRSLNKFDEALREFQHSADFWTAHGVDHQLHLLEHNIGATLMDMGRASEALVYLYRDLDSCRRVADSIGEAHTLNTIGLAYRRLGNLHKAREALLDSIQIYRQHEDTFHEGNAINDLGLVLNRENRFHESFLCHWLDLTYCWSRGDNYGAAKSLIRMADNLIHFEPPVTARAVHHLDMALKYLDTEKDRAAVASAMMVFAKIGHLAGKAEVSKWYLDQSLVIYQSVGDFDGQVESIWNDLQFAYEREDFSVIRARGTLEKFVKICTVHNRKRAMLIVVKSIAKALSEDGKFREAETLIRESRNILLECAHLVENSSRSSVDK